MKKENMAFVILFGLFIAASCLPRLSAGAERDMPNDDNWPNYGRTHDETHYSALTDINASNVSHLGLAWWFDIPGIVLAESAPLEVNGTLYFSTGYSVVRAVDAVTGRLLWVYDPQVPNAAGHKLRLLWGIRGIAYWDNKIYAGTHDGRLISIDAKTGRLIWSVATNERGDSRIITGPPRIFHGKVIIGHAAGEWGEFGKFGAVRGYVTAYDAESGKQLWRFFTVPGDPAKGFENKAMEMAAKTWSGDWWKYGGTGGTVWNAITYDPELNRIYIGTANGYPEDAKTRSPGGGDNLFLASIVALDADSGAYVWHYQTNPGETWDYDAAEDIELASLVINGVSHRVLMQASKNGFFYVLNRDRGELISAEKFAKVTWAEKIDLKTSRPVETVFARVESAAGRIWPSSDGAHGWAPMAFNPTNNLVYIPALDSFGCDDNHIDAKGNECLGTSSLLAWDPIQQRAAWRVALTGSRSGGIVTTAGKLVFQGRSDGKFAAYAADSGKELWSFDAQVGIAGAPITYRVGGRQYVSVLAGYGGGGAVVDPRWDARSQQRRLLTFALGGGAQLPFAAPRPQLVPVVDSDFKPNASAEKSGAMNFNEHCTMCHGFDAIAGGQAPDLRASPIILSEKVFAEIVKQGMLRTHGMPRFEEFSDAELEHIRQYLRSRAMDLSTKNPSPMRCR